MTIVWGALLFVSGMFVGGMVMAWATAAAREHPIVPRLDPPVRTGYPPAAPWVVRPRAEHPSEYN